MNRDLKPLIEELVLPGLRDLPNVAVTPQAAAMLTAIGLHESNLSHRYRVTALSDPMRKGDARGLWQFTTDMVRRVLNAASTKQRAEDLCRQYVGTLSIDAVWANLEFQDNLACQFARLLLLPDPAALPQPTEANGNTAWVYYVRVWNSANNAVRQAAFIGLWNQVCGTVGTLTGLGNPPNVVPADAAQPAPSTVNVAVSTSNGRRGLSVLHPQVRQKVERLMELCRQNGLPILITETLRTKEEQDRLFNQRPVVTRAQGMQSPHTWGVAIDFCRNVRGREFDNSDRFFNRVGELGKQVGLFWGGDFRTFVDMPHFEDIEFVVNNSTSVLMSRFGTFEKFKATWPD